MTTLTDLHISRLNFHYTNNTPWSNFLVNSTLPDYIPTTDQQTIWLKIYRQTFFRFYKQFRPQLTQDESYEISQRACLGLHKSPNFAYIQKVIENAHKKELKKNKKYRVCDLSYTYLDEKNNMAKIDNNDLFDFISKKDAVIGRYCCLIGLGNYTAIQAAQEMGLNKDQHRRLHEKTKVLLEDLGYACKELLKTINNSKL